MLKSFNSTIKTLSLFVAVLCLFNDRKLKRNEKKMKGSQGVLLCLLDLPYNAMFDMKPGLVDSQGGPVAHTNKRMLNLVSWAYKDQARALTMQRLRLSGRESIVEYNLLHSRINEI